RGRAHVERRAPRLALDVLRERREGALRRHQNVAKRAASWPFVSVFSSLRRIRPSANTTSFSSTTRHGRLKRGMCGSGTGEERTTRVTLKPPPYGRAVGAVSTPQNAASFFENFPFPPGPASDGSKRSSAPTAPASESGTSRASSEYAIAASGVSMGRTYGIT